MKKTILLSGALFLSFSLFAQEKSITVDKLPATTDEFIKLRDSLASTPEGGAVVMIVATQIYVKDKKTGMECITIALDNSQLGKGNVYKGFQPGGSFNFLIKQLDSRPYVPWAYVEGATAENGYQVAAPYKYVLSRNRFSGEESSGTVKVFVNTFGVNPRPLTMKRNDKGVWKVQEASSIFVAVRPPVTPSDDDL